MEIWSNGTGLKGKEMSKYKKIALKAVIVLAVSISIAFLAELVFNFKVLTTDKDNRGKQEVPLEALYTEGFEYKDGSLVMTADVAFIRIDKQSPYLSKLEYDFELEKDFTMGINLYRTENAEAEGSGVNIIDRNNIALSRSEVKIDGQVHHIDLFFDAVSKGISIDKISYDNAFNLSGRRMLAVAGFAAIILILIVFSDTALVRIEYAFLAAGFITCLTMVLTFPAQKVSWDEAYHFKQSYRMGVGTDRVITPEVSYYGSDDAVSSLMFPMTEDEFDGIEDYMDKSSLYDKKAPDNTVVKSSLMPINNIGHIASAIGISLARLMHLPLSYVYMFGKLFNMLLYIIVTFFAIKRAAIGKRILTLAALMPTPLFLASVYSYDATLNAFAFLGLSYILSEFVEKDKLITWKSFFIILISFFIVCGIKMVYAPLLLLLLILPDEKFKDKKTKYIMKYGIFVLCIIGVLVMIVPMLLDPSSRGDSRGGATDAAGQLQFILGNPLGYAKILILHMAAYGVDFTMGNGIFTSLAHYDMFPFAGYTAVIVAAVALTDTPAIKLGAKAKTFIGAVVFVIMCFVWTAMYISYTPVGSGSINGVQGRYFIPIVLPLLLLINTDRIQNNIPEKIYNAIVTLLPVLITFSMVGYKAIAYCI